MYSEGYKCITDVKFSYRLVCRDLGQGTVVTRTIYLGRMMIIYCDSSGSNMCLDICIII